MKTKVYAIYESNYDGCATLGLYSSKDKAQKVLKQLYKSHEIQFKEHLEYDPSLLKSFEPIRWINEDKFTDWNYTDVYIKEEFVK